jgi:hypothetical protein
MEEGELIMSDGLLLQKQPVEAGMAHIWPKHFVHEYSNPTDLERSILCVNAPKFIPSDERLVQNAELLSPSAHAKRFYGLQKEEK